MTKDLEETLREMGAEYRPVVERLRSAYVPYRRSPAAWPRLRRSVAPWGVALLSAAVLLVFLGLGALFRGGDRGVDSAKVYTVRASDAAHEYMLAVVRDDAAVQEMIRTQRPFSNFRTTFSTLFGASSGHTPIVGFTMRIEVSIDSRSSASCESPARFASVEYFFLVPTKATIPRLARNSTI